MAIDEAERSKNYHVQALTRGIDVLRTLAEAHRVLTVAEIHSISGISKPTLVRLLSILTKEGCTVRVDDRPSYGLGPTIAAIAAGVPADLSIEKLAEPHLRELMQATGHTANLGVLTAGEVLHASVVPSERPVRFVANAGTRDALHCTGLGKALLMGAPRSVVESLVTPEEMTRRTPTTITTLQALEQDLTASAARGFAFDDEESAQGLRCFAVPARVNGMTVAAVSVSGPSGELPLSREQDIIPALLKCAASVADDRALGAALEMLASDAEQ